jgi:hypothetical protein
MKNVSKFKLKSKIKSNSRTRTRKNLNKNGKKSLRGGKIDLPRVPRVPKAELSKAELSKPGDSTPTPKHLSRRYATIRRKQNKVVISPEAKSLLKQYPKGFSQENALTSYSNKNMNPSKISSNIRHNSLNNPADNFEKLNTEFYTNPNLYTSKKYFPRKSNVVADKNTYVVPNKEQYTLERPVTLQEIHNTNIYDLVKPLQPTLSINRKSELNPNLSKGPFASYTTNEIKKSLEKSITNMNTISQMAKIKQFMGNNEKQLAILTENLRKKEERKLQKNPININYALNMAKQFNSAFPANFVPDSKYTGYKKNGSPSAQYVKKNPNIYNLASTNRNPSNNKNIRVPTQQNLVDVALAKGIYSN